ncbi:lyase family protein [Sphaerisporangium sp. NPDC005288]|uniref:argininosuccinate lyase n=1 Tax=Sphaerisporangium sp. NPDC005288 TaxID=3155114 RepID=UPI00339E39B5
MAMVTGRIGGAPANLLHEEVLEPQFSYEVRHLLPHYLHIEKVLLLEYRRMGILAPEEAGGIASALHAITPEDLTADPEENLSDISFGIERLVAARSCAPAPRWHVDRSRNDAQACAQLMFGRERTLGIAEGLVACVDAAHRLAARHTEAPMPGYTHLQAAQVITPGFYLSALSDHLLHTLRRLLATYDHADLSPLGAGAMAGQELPWDRAAMAGHLGFAGPRTHALAAVASRAWMLELAAEAATFATGLNRFVSDLMTWAGSHYGLVELPDELAGISSAMPQKKNYPLLERIRGRTAHLLSWFVDVAAAQRGTPYSNTVEVGKEGGAQLDSATRTFASVLGLLTLVLDNAVFPAARGRELCAGEHLGGFSLANRLTLDAGVPWRTAQVIAGRYIVAMIAEGTPADPEALERVCAGAGHPVADAAGLLDGTLEPGAGLRRKRSLGSAHPDEVRAMLTGQGEELAVLAREWSARRRRAEASVAAVDGLLGLESRS